MLSTVAKSVLICCLLGTMAASLLDPSAEFVPCEYCLHTNHPDVDRYAVDMVGLSFEEIAPQRNGLSVENRALESGPCSDSRNFHPLSRME